VASESINKRDLLLVRFSGVVVRDNVSTAPDDIGRVDLSFSAVAFEKATEYHASSWNRMLKELWSQRYAQAE
jgi:hypothetical protein